MPGRIHGTNLDDFPQAEQRFRQAHRPDTVTARHDENDGWELTCSCWHILRDGRLECVDPP